MEIDIDRQKIGMVMMILSRPIPEDLKQARLVLTASGYYVDAFAV